MSNDRAIEVTLDEQIAIVEHEVKEDEGEASYPASVAILTSLRELKRIREGLREALGAIEFALGAIGKYPDRQHPMTASEVLFRNVLSSYRQYLKKS